MSLEHKLSHILPVMSPNHAQRLLKGICHPLPNQLPL